MIELFHATMASVLRRPLFVDVASVRRGVLATARIAGPELVLFNLVDDHVHNVLAATRERVGRVVQALNLALRKVCEVPIATGDIRPVEGRRHMERLVGYLLQQGPHHDLPHDPALWEGSCFADLVGARHVPGLSLQIRQALPRFRIERVFTAVGLSGVGLRPVDEARIHGDGVLRLAERAAAAAAVPYVIGDDSRAHEVVRLRRAVVGLGQAAGFVTRDLARVLGVSARALRYLATGPVSDDVRALQHATRMRYALEDACAARSSRRGQVWEPSPVATSGSGKKRSG